MTVDDGRLPEQWVVAVRSKRLTGTACGIAADDAMVSHMAAGD
jgi:hypothetical protein